MASSSTQQQRVSPVDDTAPSDHRSGRPEPAERRRSPAALLGVKRIGGVYILIALGAIFTGLTPNFLTVENLRTILGNEAVTAIMAMGLTIPLAAGVFDLSIGASMGLGGVVVSKLLVSAHMDPVLAVIVTLVVAASIGIVNGILVVGFNINAFIATLGMNSVLSALIVITSGNNDILGIPPSFRVISTASVGTLAIPIIYVAVLGVVVWYVLQRTPAGRRMYATGGNVQLARLAGVQTTSYIFVSFVCSAVAAAFAGILVTANVGTGDPTLGPSYLLPAFAACFLGATQFFPGRFNVWGTVLAVYLLATGVQGLVLLGAPFWVNELFNGAALIIAVGIGGYRQRFFAGIARRRRRAAGPSSSEGGQAAAAGGQQPAGAAGRLG